MYQNCATVSGCSNGRARRRTYSESPLYVRRLEIFVSPSGAVVNAAELSNEIDGEARQGKHHDPVIDAPGLDHVGTHIDAEEDDDPGEDEERGANGQHLLASVFHGGGTERWGEVTGGCHERGDDEHLTATSPRPGVVQGSGQGRSRQEQQGMAGHNCTLAWLSIADRAGLAWAGSLRR